LFGNRPEPAGLSNLAATGVTCENSAITNVVNTVYFVGICVVITEDNISIVLKTSRSAGFCSGSA